MGSPVVRSLCHPSLRNTSGWMIVVFIYYGNNRNGGRLVHRVARDDGRPSLLGADAVYPTRGPRSTGPQPPTHRSGGGTRVLDSWAARRDRNGLVAERRTIVPRVLLGDSP